MNDTNTNQSVVPTPTRNFKPLIVMACAMILSWMLLQPSKNAPPLVDDNPAIAYSYKLKQVGQTPLQNLFTKEALGFYRPIKNAAFDYITAGTTNRNDPKVQEKLSFVRQVGFLGFLLAGTSLFFLVRHLTNRPWLATTAGSLWLLSPSAVTTAAWVSAQNVPLAVAATCFATLLFDKTILAPSRNRAVGLGICGGLVYALGLLNYDMAVCTPVVVGIIAGIRILKDWNRGDRNASWKKGIRLISTMIGLSVITGAWLWLRKEMGAMGSAREQLYMIAPDTTPLELSAASAWFFWRHFSMWFQPFGNLEFGGTYIPGKSVTTGVLLASWGFLAAYLTAAFLLIARGIKKRDNLTLLIGGGLLTAFAGAFPSGNFIPVYAGPVNDYYTIFPSLGWATALTATFWKAWGLFHNPGKRHEITAAKIAALSFLITLVGSRTAATYITYDRSTQMNTSWMIDSQSVNVRPYQYYNQSQLSQEFIKIGNFEEAAARYEESLKTSPWMDRLIYIQALIYLKRYEEAVTNADVQIARNDERITYACHYKAIALECLGRSDEALTQIQLLLPLTNYENHERLLEEGIQIAKKSGKKDIAERWEKKKAEIYPAN